LQTALPTGLPSPAPHSSSNLAPEHDTYYAFIAVVVNPINPCSVFSSDHNTDRGSAVVSYTTAFSVTHSAAISCSHTATLALSNPSPIYDARSTTKLDTSPSSNSFAKHSSDTGPDDSSLTSSDGINFVLFSS
jgi:hypothetical protein